MLTVGLTGGIGSGKSTVAGMFAALGVPVIDADQVAREVVAPGTAGLQALTSRFGEDILTPDGELDRPKLRGIVFASAALRQVLESILHPLIRARIKALIASFDAPYCIVAIPLLIESGWTDLVDRVLVVDVPLEVQRQRTICRDSLTADEVEAIMAAQSSRSDRLDRATEVIHNDRDLATLQSQVLALHQLYSRGKN